MMKTAQHGSFLNSGAVRKHVSRSLRVKELIATGWNTRPERRMRARLVVMANPLSQQIPKVSLIERDQVVQALSPNRTPQPLAVAIGLGGTNRGSQHRNPSASTC
jgi:hypothetical protein